MKVFSKILTPKLIASQSKAKTEFKNNFELNNVAELAEANTKSVCFFENNKLKQELLQTKAGLIFVPTDFDVSLKSNTNLIFVKKPYIYFMKLVETWLKLSEKSVCEIADSAKIAKTVKIGKNVNIGHHSVLEKNVEIGDNTIIESNCVIKENSKIGNNCHIFPNTTIYHDCILRNNVILHAGCVIGADGFGYILHENIQHKIPQVGNVLIENSVEIGANSTIDRSTLGTTVIGEGTKIDNLVQVGHNCKIGKHSILCAQSGLAGGTEIGNQVYIAGQVGVAGHLKIADGAMIGAQSGVTKDVPANAKFFGTPAIDANLRKRIIASEKRLPEIIKFCKKATKKDK